MKYKKNIPMSYEQALKISNDLLNAFQFLFAITPPRLSTLVENENTKIETYTVFNNTVIHTHETLPHRNNLITDEFCLDIIYKLIIDNRCFEITFFEEPNDLGYATMLPNYDPFTYVLCDIVEKRPNGCKKFEMTFGFNIEKRTFEELFEVLHYNSVGILREYSCFNSLLETHLKDVVFFLD